MSVVRVEGQKCFDKFFGPAILEGPLKNNIALNDLLINLIGVLGVGSEGQLPEHKLIQHDASRPQIHQLIVLLAKNDLRRHVVRRANDGRCFMFVLDELG